MQANASLSELMNELSVLEILTRKAENRWDALSACQP